MNSTVPIIAEVLKKAGVFDARKLFGISTLDVVRAQTFAAEVLKKPLEAATFKVPVVGGHSGRTILPLLSQAQPSLSSVSQSDIEALTNRIQFGGGASRRPNSRADHRRRGRQGQGRRWQCDSEVSRATTRPTLTVQHGLRWLPLRRAPDRGQVGRQVGHRRDGLCVARQACSLTHADVCLTGDIEGSAGVRETVGEGVDYFAVPIELGVCLLLWASADTAVRGRGQAAPHRQALRVRAEAVQGRRRGPQDEHHDCAPAILHAHTTHTRKGVSFVDAKL